MTRKVKKLHSKVRQGGVRKAISAIIGYLRRRLLMYVYIPLLRAIGSEGIVQLEFEGVTMNVDLFYSGMSRVLLYDGVHEPKVTEIWKEVIEEDMTVVDIGGHLGYYTLLAASEVGIDGTVHSIEPVERNYKILQRNVELNRYENIETYNQAISKATGQAEIFKSDTSNWTTLDSDTAKRKPNKYTDSSLIEVVSFDEFVSNSGITNIDVVRMDLEGYETEVIQGMEKTLTEVSSPCYLFIETHNFSDGYVEMAETLESHGFELVVFTDKDGHESFSEVENGLQDVFQYHDRATHLIIKK